MKIFHSAKTVLSVWGEHASIKDNVQTDWLIHLKDLCGDCSIILFLGITGSLAFRTIIAYSNHIPHEFSIITDPHKILLFSLSNISAISA